jgi:hypothetical protein
MQSKEVEALKDEYRELNANTQTQKNGKSKRLAKVKEELSEVPSWSRETDLEQRQTKLLEDIRNSLDKQRSKAKKSS